MRFDGIDIDSYTGRKEVFVWDQWIKTHKCVKMLRTNGNEMVVQIQIFILLLIAFWYQKAIAIVDKTQKWVGKKMLTAQQL
jgi:hypothetical protein